MKALRFESAQTLIFIAVGLVALVGLTALSIDGGSVYADRRHAQNAADTAALAAALSKVNGEVWKPVGLERANSNGYDDTDTSAATTSPTSNIEIYSCDEAGASCASPYAGKSEYVQVIIRARVKTYFAPIVGISELANRVVAIARARPAEVKPWFDGNAVVSLMPGCPPNGWPSDPFTLSGDSTSIVGGSGVFVNSTCNNAITQNGTASLTVNDGFNICSNGQPNLANYALGSITPPPVACNQTMPYPPDTLIQMPDQSILLSCDLEGNGDITLISANPRVWRATPGKYYDGFPSVSPSGKLLLEKGIYCIMDGDFDLHSSWEITTDLNNNNQNDPSEGVLIYVHSGSVTFNGSSSLEISAMYSSDVPAALRGILIYLPLSNDSKVTLNGSSGTTFTGTILAPSSLIELTGNNTSYSVNSQLVGYSVKTSGTAAIQIYYDQTLNNLGTYNPQVALMK